MNRPVLVAVAKNKTTVAPRVLRVIFYQFSRFHYRSDFVCCYHSIGTRNLCYRVWQEHDFQPRGGTNSFKGVFVAAHKRILSRSTVLFQLFGFYVCCSGYRTRLIASVNGLPDGYYPPGELTGAPPVDTFYFREIMNGPRFAGHTPVTVSGGSTRR